MNRNLYIIAGCNGAGKTAIEAGRIMLRRYINGIKNLFNIYIPISDVVLIKVLVHAPTGLPFFR